MASVVLKFVIAVLVLASTIFAAGQDIPIGVTYVCSGEHLFVENCNIRDTSAGTTVVSSTHSADPATLSTPKNVLGNATLSIVSGFPTQAGAPNPLGSHPYTLLRDSIPNLVTKAGVAIPAGSNAYRAFGVACGTHSPDCQKILDAIKASAPSAVRADANGSGTFPAVPAGTYYLMISARYNNQALTWDHPVQLKPGANSMTLSVQNATPMN